MKRLRVLGVGSPNGDDAVGWLAVEAFRESQRQRDEAGIETVVLDRPGAALLSHLAGANAVIVVDAVLGNAPPGTVEQLEAGDLLGGSASVSTHRFGLASALELGRVLDLLPPRLVVLGVHVARPRAGADLSPQVRAAVTRVAERISSLCEAISSETA